ncbi:unnamed protein product [Auanema sp. JU1783]|nr:unnamed protein product [Auanema sp. JU1783]
MDEWSILDEVDVIGIWPSAEKAKITSAKWLERKESLESLLALIEKNPRLAPKATIYGEVMDDLRKIISKDSNINVVIIALKVLAGLAKGLRHNFSAFISMLYSFVLDKSKDKKQTVRDAVGEALDAMSAYCDPDRLINYINEHITKPSPQTKETILAFLYRYFVMMKGPPMAFLKSILPSVVKLANDSDPAVRESACACLGSAKRLLGDAMSTFITPINGDKKKMDLIDENLVKATEARAKFLESSGTVEQSSITETESGEVVKEEEGSSTVQNLGIDPWELKDPINLNAQISKTWMEEIQDSKWQVRKEALDNLLLKLELEPRLISSPELKEMITCLLKVIEKDLNVNVSSSAAKSMRLIALGLRYEFSPFVSKTVNISLDKLKDKKEVLRKELIGLTDTCTYMACLSIYTESISNGLKNKNPQARSQSCQFLSRMFCKHDRNTMPIEPLKTITADIEKCCSDGDGEVRESAFKVVAGIWKALGEPITLRLFPSISETKLKADKVSALVTTLTEEYGTKACTEYIRLFGNSSAKPSASKPIPSQSAPKPSSASRPQSAARRAPVRPAPVVRTQAAAPAPVVRTTTVAPKPVVTTAARQPIRPPSQSAIASARSTPVKPLSKPRVVQASSERTITPMSRFSPATKSTIPSSTVRKPSPSTTAVRPTSSSSRTLPGSEIKAPTATRPATGMRMPSAFSTTSGSNIPVPGRKF